MNAKRTKSGLQFVHKAGWLFHVIFHDLTRQVMETLSALQYARHSQNDLHKRTYI